MPLSSLHLLISLDILLLAAALQAASTVAWSASLAGSSGLVPPHFLLASTREQVTLQSDLKDFPDIFVCPQPR